MKRIFLLTCLGLFSGIPLQAGDPPSVETATVESTPSGQQNRHPIDLEIERLLTVDESTNGQVQALAKGGELWDKELNRLYKELNKALSGNGEAKKALVESQRAWIAFRDGEMKFIEAMYARKEGTMFRPMAADDFMKLTRCRALELKDRLAIVTEEGM